MLEWTPIGERIANFRIGAKPQNITVFAIYAHINQDLPAWARISLKDEHIFQV